MAVWWAAAAPCAAAEPPIEVTVILADPVAPTVPHTCTAWATAAGFLTDGGAAVATARSTRRDGAWTCALTLPGPGPYALAVMEDTNGNGQVDRNLFGMPVEGWGTSNDVVPTFRPPSFAESRVTLADGARVPILVHR